MGAVSGVSDILIIFCGLRRVAYQQLRTSYFLGSQTVSLTYTRAHTSICITAQFSLDVSAGAAETAICRHCLPATESSVWFQTITACTWS